MSSFVFVAWGEAGDYTVNSSGRVSRDAGATLEHCTRVNVEASIADCFTAVRRNGVNGVGFARMLDTLKRSHRYETLLKIMDFAGSIWPGDQGVQRELAILSSLMAESRWVAKHRASAGLPGDADWSSSVVVTASTAPEPVVDALAQRTRLLKELRSTGLISDSFYLRQTAVIDADEKTDTHVESPLVPGRDVALVIGSDIYESFAPLETAINDVRAVGRALKENFGFEVETLENATRRGILSAMTRLRKTLAPEDRLLIYYAGHGFVDTATKRGYWLPVDAEPDNPTNWLSNVDMADAINSIESQQILVVSDSCFAGSFAGEDRSRYDNESSGSNPRTRIVITSGGMEPVLDSGFDGHSIFARAFLQSLKDFDSGVSVEVLFNRLRHEVLRHADQEPRYAVLRYSRHDGGTFKFRKRPAS